MGAQNILFGVDDPPNGSGGEVVLLPQYLRGDALAKGLADGPVAGSQHLPGAGTLPPALRWVPSVGM